MKCKFYCPKMNKVLLEYSHAHSFTHICRGFHATMSELWPCNKACLWMVLSLPCSAVQQPADLRDVVIMPLFQVPSVSLYRNHCCILFTSTVTVMSKPTKLNQKKKRRVDPNIMLLSHSGLWIILLKNWTGRHCLCCIVTLQLC